MPSRALPGPAGSDTRADETASTFLLRPLTVVFFLLMLAGGFTLERLGIENPLVVPERLVGLGLLAFLVVIVATANIRSVGAGPATGTFVAAPLIYFLVTALWGADVPDYWDTVTDLTCMILACAVISILLRWNPILVAETFLWCLLIAGLVFSVAGLASASTGSQVSAFGGGPNVFSRITVLGFIALLGLVALRKLPIAALAAAPVLIVATVVSGSRGGMLAGLLSLLVLVPLVRQLGPVRVVAGIGLLAACMGFVYEKYSDNVERVIDGRIVELTFQQGYTSGRGDLFGHAWGMFLDNLVIGAGLRAFAADYGRGFTYPHSLFLHAAAEGGLIGFIILMAVMVTFARRILRRHGSTLTLLYTAAASVIFTSAMFSGDYYDSRFLWVFMIIALQVAAHAARSESLDGPTTPERPS